MVNWSSRHASQQPMSGEITFPEISVCGNCNGHGMDLPKKPIPLCTRTFEEIVAQEEAWKQDQSEAFHRL